ncbi:hypothetical protein SEVIR_3G379566v4 [Setaria viridis]
MSWPVAAPFVLHNRRAKIQEWIWVSAVPCVELTDESPLYVQAAVDLGQLPESAWMLDVLYFKSWRVATLSCYGSMLGPSAPSSESLSVERHNNLDLYIEGAPRDDYPFVGKEKQPMSCSWRQYSFGSGYHGTDEREVELGVFAELSAKVIWKSYGSW